MNPTNTYYEPELLLVKKDAIYASISAVEAGLEYARECLSQHDRWLGRTTYKNKTWAETMEKDIRNMEAALEMLRNPETAKPLFTQWEITNNASK